MLIFIIAALFCLFFLFIESGNVGHQRLTEEDIHNLKLNSYSRKNRS